MFHIIITPIKQDVTIATPRANRFLFIAIFFPKYLASKGTVAIPTIIKAEINIAICAYPAPACNNEAARGNATNPGINVILPIIAAIIIPNTPDSAPSNLEIVFSSKMDKIKPINKRIASTDGKIFSNDFHAFFNAVFVFLLSFMNDIISHITTTIYRTLVNTANLLTDKTRKLIVLQIMQKRKAGSISVARLRIFFIFLHLNFKTFGTTSQHLYYLSFFMFDPIVKIIPIGRFIFPFPI